MRLWLFALLVLPACAALNRPLPEDPALEIRRREASADPAGPLVVATYNVHMESAAEIVDAIARAPELAGVDVLLMQEIEHDGGASESMAAQVAARLGMSHAYAPGYGRPRGGSHGVALLARGQIRDVDVIELPRFDVAVNSARRIALAATVRHRGRWLRIYSVHLDNRINPGDRRAQLAPVLDDADRHRALPAIIAGDVNTSPFCWIGHLIPVPCGLQTRRLERLVRRRGFATPTADSGATSRYLAMRLDAVYVRGLEVFDVDVADVWLSDHFPLVVRILR